MSLQFGQVVEGIGPAELAGVDETHEHIADVSAVLGLVEQRILSMNYGPFQCPLDDVVVQRRSGLTQEEGQLLSVPEQVGDGCTEPRVGFHEPVLELPRAPYPKLLHDRATLGLVEGQSLLWR